MNTSKWAFKTIGFPRTPAGDLALLVLTTATGRDFRSPELLSVMGLHPLTTAEDLLRPVKQWSASVEDDDVVVRHQGQEVYRPASGFVPAAWTHMAVSTGRIVLVSLPGQEKPDDQQLLTLLRRGDGLWGTISLT